MGRTVKDAKANAPKKAARKAKAKATPAPSSTPNTTGRKRKADAGNPFDQPPDAGQSSILTFASGSNVAEHETPSVMPAMNANVTDTTLVPGVVQNINIHPHLRLHLSCTR